MAKLSGSPLVFAHPQSSFPTLPFKEPTHGDCGLLHCAASLQLYTFIAYLRSHQLALLPLPSAFGISFQVIHVVDYNDHDLQRNKSTSYDYGDINIPSPSEVLISDHSQISKRSNGAETSTFMNIIESTERRTHIRIHPQQLNERLHNGAYITTDRLSQRNANLMFTLRTKHLTSYNKEVF